VVNKLPPKASVLKQKPSPKKKTNLEKTAKVTEKEKEQMHTTEEEEESEVEDEVSEKNEAQESENDSYWFTSDEEDSEEDNPEHIKAERMVMFAAYTHYDVIKEVSKFTF